MDHLRDELLYGDAIEDIPEPSPLIESVLDFDSTALLYGASGSGKSFVALDWALCVATGTPWHDHPTVQGKVLYVVGEGLSGTRGRYQAWKKHHGIASVPDIIFAPRAVNVLREEGRRELLAAVARVEPIFTMLDTVARHIAGGDENSFEAMSLVVQTLDTLRIATGGCALGIHHSGKHEDQGARGHSSLKGAMDTEILCTKGPKLTATKQKNHEDGHIIGSFKLESIGPSMVLAPTKSNPNDELAVRALGMLGGEAHYVRWRRTSTGLGLPLGSFARTVERLVLLRIVETDTTRDTTDTESVGKRYRLV